MSEEFRADLHCHSRYSDGSDEPSDLLDLAKRSSLQGLSITDHDTIEAYTEELFEKAKCLQLKLLPGVEVSSEIEGASVHILGYGFCHHNEGFSQFLSEIQKRREKRNFAMVKKLSSLGFEISEEELLASSKSKVIGRPHIAKILLEKGYVQTIRQAFDLYLKEGARCFVSGIRFHPREAIEEIRKAKGKAILAHPHFLKRGAFLKKVLALPLDGLECYYSRLDKSIETPWVQMAKDKGWIATGGSDYHGSFKPHIPLGASWVDRETFEKLLNS